MLALVLKGLRKLYPSGARLRHPILQQHLRLVRSHFDLAGNQFHRTLSVLVDVLAGCVPMRRLDPLEGRSSFCEELEPQARFTSELHTV